MSTICGTLPFMLETDLKPCRYLVLALVLASTSLLRADDWPNWRGPNHNGISAETGWTQKWPIDGPSVLWKKSVGLGFSSMAVAGGRVYTMGNKGEADTVFCLDAGTGKALWKYSYPCPSGPLFYEGGPSATPTVDGDRVFTLSKRGDLFCFSAGDGKIVWSKNIAKTCGLDIPMWGFASSALIQGNLLLLDVGSRGMAFDKTSGKVIWASGAGKAGYSTPVPCSFEGKSALAMLSGCGAVGVDLATGKQLWLFPWKADYDINAPDPVVAGTEVFVSSTYGKTDALLNIQGGTAKPVWRNNNLLIQLNSPVLVDGYLYGVAGIAGPTPNASLKCVDWQTGAVKWSYPDLGGGALMVANNSIIALSDKGELFTAAASPQGFNPISRVQVLGGRCWTVPVLANGRIYCRNARGDLVCLDVKAH